MKSFFENYRSKSREEHIRIIEHLLQNARECEQKTVELKEVESQLRQRDTELAKAQKLVHLGHWTWDIRSGSVEWSDEVYRILGVDPGEFEATYDAYINAIHPDDRDRVNQAVNAALRHEIPYNMIYRILRPDGSIRYIHSQGEVVFSPEGEPEKMLRTVLDVTEQTRARQELQDAKDQAELYLDVMGHDINNLNQVALGNLDMLLDDANLTAEQKELVTDALNSIKSSASIIDNVRKIRAINEAGLTGKPEDINALILKCIAEAPRLEDQAVVINYAPRGGLMIRGTALMKEVFSNILTNAIKHTGRDVTIDISVDKTARAGKTFYDVIIADNGPGIPDSLKPKLFNRFQRGDTKVHGKGLGLFIVKSLVEQAGGDVAVTDRIPGDSAGGAKFIISLPACGECK